MKKNFIYFICILFLILTINYASAWFPNTHTYILNKIEAEKSGIEFEYCFDGSVNEQALRTGNILPDITALDYLNPNKNYESTHGWNFYKKLMEKAESNDEKCLAYGVAVHLASDSIAHYELIPLRIEKTKFQNWIVHPITEEKYDAWILSMDESLFDETEKSMDAFESDRKEKYIENVEYGLGGEANLDVRKKINSFTFFLKVLNRVDRTDSSIMRFTKLIHKDINEEVRYYTEKSRDLVLGMF